MILAEFEFGTSMGPVTDSMNELIGEVELPAAVLGATELVPDLKENPRVIPINVTGMLPLVTFSLSGDATPEQLKAVAEADIVPALSEIDGVLGVETVGGQNDRVIITPDPAKMNQYGLSMAQIIGALPPEYQSLEAVASTPLGPGLSLGSMTTVDLGPTSAIGAQRRNQSDHKRAPGGRVQHGQVGQRRGGKSERNSRGPRRRTETYHCHGPV